MLYVFVDESGNFDFSPSGSKYYTVSALSIVRPFPFMQSLIDLKHDFWQNGHEIEYFHASVDSWPVRNQVFGLLKSHISCFKVDSLIIEKRKTHPVLQKDKGRFYRKMFSILLDYVLRGQSLPYPKVLIITDSIPVQQNRNNITKALKLNLAKWAILHNSSYDIFHLSARSEINLQVVDYINWAIFRKWEQGDASKYLEIKSCIKSEFDVFHKGAQNYY